MGEVRRLRARETDVQSTIVDLAGLRRWSVYHTYDARRSAAGFPDLVLWRDRVVYAELKRVGEKPRPSQRVALDGLASAGAEVYLWTLDDLVEISRVLDRGWTWLHGEGKGGSLGREQSCGFVDVWTPASLWIPGHGRRDA